MTWRRFARGAVAEAGGRREAANLLGVRRAVGEGRALTKRLRERIATPLVVCEHVRGLEAKAAFVLGAAAISFTSTRNTTWASPER